MLHTLEMRTSSLTKPRGPALKRARTVVAPPGDGGMAEVRHFLLHEASLEEYADAFEASGYDDLAFLQSIGAADFEVLSRDTAMKKGHAHKLAWKLGLRRDGGAYVRP